MATLTSSAVTYSSLAGLELQRKRTNALAVGGGSQEFSAKQQGGFRFPCLAFPTSSLSEPRSCHILTTFGMWLLFKPLGPGPS